MVILVLKGTDEGDQDVLVNTLVDATLRLVNDEKYAQSNHS